MNINPKSKLYIQLSILTLVFFGFLFVAYYIFGLVKQESKNLTNKKTELFQIKEKRKKIIESFEKFDLVKDDVKKLDNFLLASDDELKFIVFLEDVARKYMLNQSINISGQQKNKNLKYITFQVSLSGPFDGVMRFIKEVENAPYYANIINLSLKRVEVGRSVSAGNRLDYPLKENDVSASFVIRVYNY